MPIEIESLKTVPLFQGLTPTEMDNLAPLLFEKNYAQSATLFVEGMTGGRGFIALAVVIVGKWTPWRLALAALLFGALDALALRAQALAIGLPYQLLLALPYLVTLLVYAGLVGQARQPAALSKPYIRD